MKLRKLFNRLSAIFMALFVLFGFSGVYATKNTEKLLRRMYTVRLEYDSDSLSSERLRGLIELLEETGAVNWDSMLDWVLDYKIKAICADREKLCTDREVEINKFRLSMGIIADFGKSLMNNHWLLISRNGIISLECISTQGCEIGYW